MHVFMHTKCNYKTWLYKSYCSFKQIFKKCIITTGISQQKMPREETQNAFVQISGLYSTSYSNELDVHFT